MRAKILIKTRHSLPAISTIALGLLILSPYILTVVVDYFNMIHMPPTSCASKKESEVFCQEKYFDDGRARLSLSQSDRENCCLIERTIIEGNIVDLNDLACASRQDLHIDCSQFQGVSRRGMQDWIVDGQVLTIVRDSR
jgi:hypothetical protein